MKLGLLAKEHVSMQVNIDKWKESASLAHDEKMVLLSKLQGASQSREEAIKHLEAEQHGLRFEVCLWKERAKLCIKDNNLLKSQLERYVQYMEDLQGRLRAAKDGNHHIFASPGTGRGWVGNRWITCHPSHQHMYWSYLKACNLKSALFFAKRLHAQLVFHGQEFVSSLGDYLLSTLFACGGFKLAVQLFLVLPRKAVFTWKAIITGYIDYGLEQQALCLFKTMLEDGVEPDKYTYAILIKGYGNLEDLDQGRAIHADAQEKGLHRDAFVVSALIHMYGKCMSIAEAEIVFADSKLLGDVVLWNTMLSVYVEQGEVGKAFQLYRQMQEEGPQPNSRTFIIVVSACCSLGEKEETAMMCLAIGEALHSDAQRMGFGSNAILGNNLLRMYGKCGCLTRAQSVFNDMLQKSFVSWTLHILNWTTKKLLCNYTDRCTKKGYIQTRRLLW